MNSSGGDRGAVQVPRPPPHATVPATVPGSPGTTGSSSPPVALVVDLLLNFDGLAQASKATEPSCCGKDTRPAPRVRRPRTPAD